MRGIFGAVDNYRIVVTINQGAVRFMGYFDLYQLTNLTIAGITNILAIYLVITLGYWIYRLRNSKTSLRPFIFATFVAKLAVWFWTFLNILDIIFNDTNPPLLTLPARLAFLFAVVIQSWVTTRIRPAPHLSSTNLATELNTGGQMILIVEDSEPLARIYRRTLEMVGLNAEFATSGTDALIIIGQERPCLMIVDLGLPDMNGVEFVTKARELGYVGPAIAISGAIDLVDPNKLIPAQFNETLMKPVSMTDLVAVVHKWAKLGARK